MKMPLSTRARVDFIWMWKLKEQRDLNQYFERYPPLKRLFSRFAEQLKRKIWTCFYNGFVNNYQIKKSLLFILCI